MKIYQQIDSNLFHIGTSAHGSDWPGALDVHPPIYDRSKERAKWDGAKWIVKTIQDWRKDSEVGYL